MNPDVLEKALCDRVMECHDAVSPGCIDSEVAFDSVVPKGAARG